MNTNSTPPSEVPAGTIGQVWNGTTIEYMVYDGEQWHTIGTPADHPDDMLDQARKLCERAGRSFDDSYEDPFL